MCTWKAQQQQQQLQSVQQQEQQEQMPTHNYNQLMGH